MVPLLYVNIFIIRHILYFYILFIYVIYVTWSRNLLKLHNATSTKTITSNVRGNSYKNKVVAYLHVTWPNHAKVIKATAPKVALMKGTPLNRPCDLIMWYLDKWKEHVATFTKVFRHQIWKKQNIVYLFFRFKIYMTNDASWNE